MTVYRELPRTLLPLDEFARILGIDRAHFRQVTTALRPGSTCSKVWKQYNWQEAGQVSRYEVAEKIQMAEQTIANYLGYELLPNWHADERIDRVPEPDNTELFYLGRYNVRGENFGYKARWGHFVEAGEEAKTLIVAATAVTYSDEDGDSYDETATISFATTVTDEEEIRVYYPSESGADKWEIRPLNTVSISGGTCTVTMFRHQLVQPNLIEAQDPVAAEGATDASFLTTVDVYRVYNDPEDQATLIWNPNLYNCSSCGGTSTTGCCQVCGQTTQTGCIGVKNYRTGYLTYRPATYEDSAWTSATLTCGRAPDLLTINYRAGLRDQSQDWPTKKMTPNWARAVTYLAVTYFDRDVCDCAPVKSLMERWRQDLAINTTNQSFQNSDKILNNPFGTTRAAQYVWELIKAPGQQVGEAVKW